MSHTKFQVIVIGGGHAGCEAALAAARMGRRTALATLSASTIGQMSCNPAIGGVGKGQLVKEIDALGGEMGLAADRTAIHFRRLNASKGHAVRSSRCQSDRRQYRLDMQRVVRGQENLFVVEDKVTDLIVRNGRVAGVKTRGGLVLSAPAVVITTGTFLNGRMFVGTDVTPGGRAGEEASNRLADGIRDLGFPVRMFKTGTPPRLDGRSIDFSRLEVQPSDPEPLPFSFRTGTIAAGRTFVPCHLTRTTETTHDIIRANLHRSPMYSGLIRATGVRYCPSIEDKVTKFGERPSHNVFLEPEGLDTDEIYPNGISTGLPAGVQEEMVRSIPGLERARISRPGYSIEHGVIPPTEVTPGLETRRVKGLFLAGQINGTTGYEEAAAQGIIAGINAALAVRGEPPFGLGRDEAYIGVLIDDLTTKGTDEPYRMFTSRVEYRLIVREDNADRRLCGHGRRFGLIAPEDFDRVRRKYDAVEREIRHLETTRIAPGSDEGRTVNRLLAAAGGAPLRQPSSLSDLLKRPEVSYAMIAPFDGGLKDFPPEVIGLVEYEIKYEGFIRRQMKDVERFRHIENIRIPPGLDFDRIPGLSTEIRQKLRDAAPLTLGRAERIPGVTPAAISVLMVYLRKLALERSAKHRPDARAAQHNQGG